MYAIIETGGKQYSVAPGDEVRVERLDGDVGDRVEFDRVVAVSEQDGRLRTGDDVTAIVSGTISSQGRAKKIHVFKFKRRKMYRRRIGHRQSYTQVRIDSISGPGDDTEDDSGAEAAEDASEASGAEAAEDASEA